MAITGLRRASTLRRSGTAGHQWVHDNLHRQKPRVSNTGALLMAWSLEEKTEILRGLADWQERDVDGVGAAEIKILTESSPTAVLTRYYESLAAGQGQQMLLVAPSCAIESDCTAALEAALSSTCFSKVYHPDVEQGLGGKAPHLALWHEGLAAQVLSPSSVLEEQTSSLPQKGVMEEVFLWLQRTMLGMVDEEEEAFVNLGRKLLTVHKYVVVNATTEAELSRAFWQEATALAKHGVTAAAEMEKRMEAEEMAREAAARAKQDAEEQEAKARVARAKVDKAAVEVEENQDGTDGGKSLQVMQVTGSTKKDGSAEKVAVEDVLKPSGLGGGDDPRENSVLLALPGFRFKDRAGVEEFIRAKLVAPLEALSPFGAEGVELSADVYAAEDLKFPVMIVSPHLKTYEAPEGGYKFIYRGEEQDADEYIRVEELKLQEAEAEAKERIEMKKHDPLFGPRSQPSPPSGDEELS